MATKSQSTTEKQIRDIRRKSRRGHSPEEKIRIILEGLRGEVSIAELFHREGSVESLYYCWSEEGFYPINSLM